uniref:Uncharacterized protein n=1 Tax=Strigamia maritima TaxID=126957 RepID=T1IYG5_STRMM
MNLSETDVPLLYHYPLPVPTFITTNSNTIILIVTSVTTDHLQGDENLPFSKMRMLFAHRKRSSELSPDWLLQLLDAQQIVPSYQAVGAGEEDRLEIDPNGSAIWSSNPSEMPLDADVPEDGFKSLKQWLSPIISIFQLITRQSYIATLIVMMAWSITYHSWLTFILLLWSCVLWMMPNSRSACWKSSPFLVIYAEALIIIQYVYGLNLNNDELSPTIDTVNLTQIGLEKTLYLPCIPLAVKILYTFMFWMTLRQYMQEKYRNKNKDIAEGVMMQPVSVAYAVSPGAEKQRPDLQRQHSTVYSSALMKKLGIFVHSLLTKYWIWVVALMLMLNALGGQHVVIFRIIYMVLFLFFILMFQLSYRIWRAIMYGFWLTVIIYSMTLLILIYTYQFQHFPEYWAKYLHISLELQQDIGLEYYDTGGLFINLLRATFFVIITIIQLHYFHNEFLRISDINQMYVGLNNKNVSNKYMFIFDESLPPGPSATENPLLDEDPKIPLPQTDVPTAPPPQLTDEEHDSNDLPLKPKLRESLIQLIQTIMDKVVYVYNVVSDFCWRYLEIHIIKIVLFSVLLLALYDTSAVNFLFIILVVVATPIRKVQNFISHCCAIWASVLLISKMIYQINYVTEYWKSTCDVSLQRNLTEADIVPGLNSTIVPPFSESVNSVNRTINNAHWIGFKKVDNLTEYIKGYLGLIFVLTIQAVVKIRMRHHRKTTNEVESKWGVVFPEVTRVEADNSLTDCAKFLINYGFYKFGFEICLMTISAAVGIRLDLFAVIYALWLSILFLLRRSTLMKVWPLYVIFLCCILPIQYLLCLGLPPGLCYLYDYETLNISPELREWLFSPDYLKPPHAYKLTVDFFLLLFASCQLWVFAIERKPGAENYEGGSNQEIIYISNYPANNTMTDYVTYTKSYLDLVKVVLFSSFYWITLAIFFLAGTNRVSLFAMGYVIGCFLFLWNGQEFFMKPIKYILKWWNVLISYTIVVIFIKSGLQLIGCVWLKLLYTNYCWLIQLFSIACLNKFEKSPSQIAVHAVALEQDCQVPVDDAGLLWDGICLAFLLVQKRFFCSYYFPHLVTEMRAQAALANRGAELINQMLMKEVAEQQAAEKDIVEKIKKKMDKIRMNQQKIRGSEYIDPDNHFTAADSNMEKMSSFLPPDVLCLLGWDSDMDPEERGSEYSALSTPMYSMSTSPHPGAEAEPGVGAAGTAIPSPSSAVNTFSLDGYMEPKFSTGTALALSQSQAHGTPSEEESFPVFSPPPYPALQGLPYTPRSSLVEPSSHPISHRASLHRPSISVSSPVPSHHTCKNPQISVVTLSTIRSGDYYLFEDFSDDEGLAELEYESKKPKELDGEEDEVPVKGIPVTKLLASAMKTDIKQAVTAAKQAKGADSDVAGSSEPTTSGPTDRSGKTPVSRTVSGASGVSFAPSPRDSLTPYDPKRPPRLSPGGSRKMPMAQPEDSEVLGTSTGPEASSKDEEEGKTKPKESVLQRIQNLCRFLWVFMEGLMISATAKLNFISRNYRYVARCLSKEKKALKEKWQIEGYDDGYQQKSTSKIPEETLAIRVEKPSDDHTDNSVIVHDTPESLEKEFEAEQPPIIRLLVASWYAAVSRSEIVCYIMIVINQINSASILSLPLPLMTFLWGTLSIPRPSKTFWITIITYTEAIVVIKYMFQFGFFPWNNETVPPNKPFWAPRIMGIEKKDQYALYDLALLLVVFFHRFILKSLGLWKDTSRFDADAQLTHKSDETKEASATSKEASAASKEESDTIAEKEGEVASVSQKDETTVDQTQAGSVVIGLTINAILFRFLQYIQPIRSFIDNLLNPPYRVRRDVYAFMFLCDFITFLIVVFGYWAFGVPVPFLIMLIAQFGLIVADRALFLRKYILGKLIFQIFIVILVHIWMFFILPVVSERQFNSNLPPQLWYFVKCMYLLLSAYQIRSGYPTRILGNFLTKNTITSILFFSKVPFLFELRALMDWIWTDTSMAIGSWLKMEDIFANIFMQKCLRRAEAEYPVPRGEKRNPIVKYGLGGSFLFVIILIIWFPLVLFALQNTVGLPNRPTGCTIEVSFSGFEPIFKMSAQLEDLKVFSPSQYESLSFQYRASSSAQSFLSNYDSEDVYVAQLSGSSTSYWIISPPSQDKLLTDLNSNYEMTVKFSWQFFHAAVGKNAEPMVGDEYITKLPPNETARLALAAMIKQMGSSGAAPVMINHLMPKYIRVPSSGKAVVAKALLKEPSMYNNLSLLLKKDSYTSGDEKDQKVFWVVQEDCENNPYKRIPYTVEDCHESRANFSIVSFNDKVFPATLALLSGFGLMGLYTTLVLLASRYVRAIFAGVSYTIMFDDMPNVDRILQLCLDIYLVRESQELKLEEDLFAKLIFLYRSPETLIKWTRYPHMQNRQQGRRQR